MVRRILADNSGRDPEMLARKFAAMRRAPFTFYRGTAHLFYDAADILSPLTGAPATWSSGDAHLENFGCYKGDNRLAYFDVNDFDEAALAPLTWDLVRLLASAHLGAGPEDFAPADRRDLARAILTDYVAEVRTGKARWIERATAEGPIRKLLRQARRRTRRQLLDERTVQRGRTRRLRILPGRQRPAPRQEQAAVRQLLEGLRRTAEDPGFFALRDVVRRVAGLASLGVPRFAALVEGRGSPHRNYLLDLKAAVPSAMALASPVAQPHWQSEAERIVTVQGWVQAVSPALLLPVRLGRRSMVLRELQPTADRLRAAQWRLRGLALGHLAHATASVVAWGHLRAAGRRGAAPIEELIAFARRRDWQRPVLHAAEAMARRSMAEWEAFRADPSVPKLRE